MTQPILELKHLMFVRRAFLGTISKLSVEQLNKIPDGFSNNLIWNFAHCIVSTQYMCYSPTGNPHGISKEMMDKYKRGSKPESDASENEINYWKELAISSIQQLETDSNAGLLSTYHAWSIGEHYSIASIEDALSFCYFHEGSHYGYALAMKKVL